MSKINSSNCNQLYFEKLKNLEGDLKGESASWQVVYVWCIENGMFPDIRTIGLENVIKFLEQLKSKRQPIIKGDSDVKKLGHIELRKLDNLKNPK